MKKEVKYMKNNKVKHYINLTHIATDYPDRVTISNAHFRALSVPDHLQTDITDHILNSILTKACGPDWADQYFYEGVV
jgi:hypothetical protein